MAKHAVTEATLGKDTVAGLIARLRESHRLRAMLNYPNPVLARDPAPFRASPVATVAKAIGGRVMPTVEADGSHVVKMLGSDGEWRELGTIVPGSLKYTSDERGYAGSFRVRPRRSSIEFDTQEVSADAAELLLGPGWKRQVEEVETVQDAARREFEAGPYRYGRGLVRACDRRGPVS
ncbi:hypothetical protein KDJ57_gp41 [Gordonia phage Catfish]|uniref:Uncharacterized protein n=1 Tax=Gordonia phage Catfish TaxID=2301538 RepID=A0A385D1L2_9CAUD|nr:hypothetical protein KDJ57_gp41 [Gordonia phage Catfish]AXQ51904.1 hypothetical protein SEA_CATFISH_68 [Gordonia phage Catfish]